MLHIIEHTLLDTVKLIPFLFITYLIIGALECKAGEKWWQMITQAGKKGPVIGGLLGAIPQCGFSAISSQFYSAELISMGTLVAVYLSTSDEMIPIMISFHAPLHLIIGIVTLKVVIGIIIGFIIDKILKSQNSDIDTSVEFESCGCGNGSIVLSAVIYTLQITAFLLIFTFALNLLMHHVGHDTMTTLMSQSRFLGPLVSGLIGLIPNCAGSVLITELYLENVINLGTLLAGLLTAAGVGPLMLFRINKSKKETLSIIGIVYFVGVLIGILCPF